jgi:hypothetical protein
MAGRTLLAPQGFNSTRINANGTFTIFTLVANNPSGPVGLFGGIQVNAQGTTWTLTIYDGSVAQNVIIGVLAPTAPMPLGGNPFALVNGLTVVAAGTTPGDVTVAWL